MSSDTLKDITAVVMRKSMQNNPVRAHVGLAERKLKTFPKGRTIEECCQAQR